MGFSYGGGGLGDGLSRTGGGGLGDGLSRTGGGGLGRGVGEFVFFSGTGDFGDGSGDGDIEEGDDGDGGGGGGGGGGGLASNGETGGLLSTPSSCCGMSMTTRIGDSGVDVSVPGDASVSLSANGTRTSTALGASASMSRVPNAGPSGIACSTSTYAFTSTGNDGNDMLESMRIEIFVGSMDESVVMGPIEGFSPTQLRASAAALYSYGRLTIGNDPAR